MQKMEIKFKIANENTTREVVKNNLELFHKLDLIGVKNINTAIDYLHITNVYDEYRWIDNERERKDVVASKLKVTKKTVQNALNLMRKTIKLKI